MKKLFNKFEIRNEFSAFNEWEDVRDLPLSAITRRDADTQKLDGLVIKGYEMKFADGINANGERYTIGCSVDFIRDYFVNHGLNMPVDVEHDPRPEWLVGIVLYYEENNTGIYPVAYIPRTHPKFDTVKCYLENGMLQGFSKCGWCTEGDWVDDKNTPNGGYWRVDKVEIIRMSLVATPANGIGFEKIAEIKNKITLVDNTKRAERTGFAAMFN